MNYFLKYVVLLANNLTASGIIMQYWLPNVNVAVWVVSFAVIVIIINVRSLSFIFDEGANWVVDFIVHACSVFW